MADPSVRSCHGNARFVWAERKEFAAVHAFDTVDSALPNSMHSVHRLPFCSSRCAVVSGLIQAFGVIHGDCNLSNFFLSTTADGEQEQQQQRQDQQVPALPAAAEEPAGSAPTDAAAAAAAAAAAGAPSTKDTVNLSVFDWDQVGRCVCVVACVVWPIGLFFWRRRQQHRRLYTYSSHGACALSAFPIPNKRFPPPLWVSLQCM